MDNVSKGLTKGVEKPDIAEATSFFSWLSIVSFYRGVTGGQRGVDLDMLAQLSCSFGKRHEMQGVTSKRVLIL
jgi:hypothetical protein